MDEYLKMSREQLEIAEKELTAVEKENSRLYMEFLILLRQYKANEESYSEKDFSFFIDNITKSLETMKITNKDLREQIEFVRQTKG
ncbi:MULTISPECIES: hypothetical protein [Paenibacillus]|uniref:hypothetical protein n=1 Tax=Paenibacillus TaxID=44249 RepID=UPI00083D6308|nr:MULTISPECIES: hypothetical protein [Paenibacillus]APQ59400.1 hypothetical protein VK72_11965 [Paenibacillus polymyxa]ODB57657.1 hypothetical protein A7309_24630 [Paenibacillus polymyxa]QYK67287.1 hypothetical protein KAI36_02437 [Paenibacillus sp. S02]VUG08650.1 hypothetical protein PPOLYM_05095 [Paenibacillus polymyxa]